MTIQCCRCKRVRNGEEWTPPGVASLEAVSHTYCPTCLDESMAEMKAELSEAPRTAHGVSRFLRHALGA
jgi:hypothetical protein